MQQSRHLVLIRHAEAEQAAPTDLERALTPDGRRAAAAAGAWLATVVVPDHALVSAARRAQQTWAEVAAGGGWALAADVSPALYSAEQDTALDLVREAPAEARALVVVGHNPTMASLVQILDDGRGDPAAETAVVTRGFPPGAVAVFEYDGDWADLDLTSARLVALHVDHP